MVYVSRKLVKMTAETQRLVESHVIYELFVENVFIFCQYLHSLITFFQVQTVWNSLNLGSFEYPRKIIRKQH